MEEIQEILKLLNPWWKDNLISQELARPYKREIFPKISGLINYRQIVLLSGLRRVGKTTLLYQIIELLIKKINSKKILYFNFDKKVEEIIEILESYQKLVNINWKKEKMFVFLDEITRLNEWATKLKMLYDAFPNLKFFISSSGSLSLEEEAIKNLGGRYFIFNIKPLSFKEYLELKNKKNMLKEANLFEKEIKEEIESYLLRSFPEIVNWEDELLIKDYLRSTIIDRIVKSDLLDRFKNLNKDLLENLLKLFYSEPGIYLDYDGLSKSMKISKKTLIKHIYYLEFSYLIKRIRNFRVSTLSSLRKLQRVYAYWWPVAYCYGSNFDKIMENIVISYADGKNYWRKDGKEIDLVLVNNKGVIPIEIKNKTNLSKEDLKNMIYFLKKNKLRLGYFIYNGEEKEMTLNNKAKIIFIPLWKWLMKN